MQHCNYISDALENKYNIRGRSAASAIDLLGHLPSQSFLRCSAGPLYSTSCSCHNPQIPLTEKTGAKWDKTDRPSKDSTQPWDAETFRLPWEYSIQGSCGTRPNTLFTPIRARMSAWIRCSVAFLAGWPENGTVFQLFLTKSSTGGRLWWPWGATAESTKPLAPRWTPNSCMCSGLRTARSPVFSNTPTRPSS